LKLGQSENGKENSKSGLKKSRKKKKEEESQEPEKPQGPTKKDIFYMRQEVADKALISAVKTLAQLQRANDLMAYSKHPRINKSF
jgi:hypothetical protein